MDESVLERFFRNFIANDSSTVEKEEVNEKQGDELFLSLLPDELLNKDVTDSSAGLDHDSQNSTAAAELPGGGSSTLELDASPVGPTTPERPVTQQPDIPQIRNVVSTVKLGCCLDLNLIAHKVWNVEYNSKVITMRIREPRTTALIYKSGNIICTGAKSVEQSRLAARKYTRIVQKLGFPARFLNFKIRSLMATVKTFPLSLEQLAHHQHCSYEPERFPGLHYKVMPGITATIFVSGKISLTAKKEAEIYEVFDTIYPILSCFRR